MSDQDERFKDYDERKKRARLANKLYQDRLNSYNFTGQASPDLPKLHDETYLPNVSPIKEMESSSESVLGLDYENDVSSVASNS